MGASLSMIEYNIKNHVSTHELDNYLTDDDFDISEDVNNIGNTLLHMACIYRDISHLTVILKYMTNKKINGLLHKKNHENMTPMMIICTNNSLDLLDVILKFFKVEDSITYDVILHASQTSNETMLLKLIKLTKITNLETIFLNMINRVGKTLVLTNYAVFEHSIRKNRDLINLTDANSDNILSLIVQKNDQKLCKYLLEYEGLNINNKNKSGATPLILAMIYRFYDIAKLLISRGCDKTITDSHGNNPLNIACQQNNLELVLLILPESDYSADDLMANHDFDIDNAILRTSDKSIIRHLISCGANTKNRTLLNHLINLNLYEIIEEHHMMDLIVNKTEEILKQKVENLDKQYQELSRDHNALKERYDLMQGKLLAYMDLLTNKIIYGQSGWIIDEEELNRTLDELKKN
jgi:ankyrin repeat protein